MSKQRQTYMCALIRSLIQPVIAVWVILTCVLSGCTQSEEVPVTSTHLNTTIISLESATNDLINLMTDLESRNTRDGLAATRKIGATYTLSYQGETRSDSTAPVAYIINFENNQGYAIMSADERMPSLLCFVENGNLTPGDTIQNPGNLIFLQGLEEYYEQKIRNYTPNDRYDKDIVLNPVDHIDTAPYITYGPWENTVYKPYGCCPVKWGQREPYNNYCPVKKGERTLAGCVAVAVGQLMATHKYPSHYKDYVFDWDAMTASRKAMYVTENAQHQIARLMQQLGQDNNLNMDYGIKKSGAKFKHVMRTLQHFGYSNSGNLIKYDISQIVEDLKNGYPVLCGGFSKRKELNLLGITIASWLEKGHSWLLHGLLERKRTCYWHSADGKSLSSHVESVYYPLCNWGWNGTDDGYYLSGVFDACNGPEYDDYTRSDDNTCEGDTSYYYRHGIEVIKGIRK